MRRSRTSKAGCGFAALSVCSSSSQDELKEVLLFEEAGVTPSTIPGRARVLQRSSRRRNRDALLLASTVACVALGGCCGPDDPNCRIVSIGPSTGEVIGVAVGVGAGIATIVAVEVHHVHHTLQGCVFEGPGTDLQIRRGAKTYTLVGNTAGILTGEKVRLSGTRMKAPKHSNLDPAFMVRQITRDYGRCTTQAGSASANTHSFYSHS